MAEVKINREHKDRLFRLLFGEEKNKENLLSLYNAINNTCYTDVADLEITTIEDCIYMGMKNDVSLLLHQVLALYEQQSSWNPNMPLRGFMYFSHLFEKYIAENKHNIYGSKLIKLPIPQYIVFYNGTTLKQDEVKLKLSDAFDTANGVEGFEWTATVKNINIGHNKELMESCKTLKEYAQFVEKIRHYRNELGNIEEAVEKTIQECIQEDILADFLLAHRAEVIDVCLTEYNEEFVINALREESREEGYEEGREAGREEGREEGKAEGLRSLVKTVKSLVGDDYEGVCEIIRKNDVYANVSDAEIKKYW